MEKIRKIILKAPIFWIILSAYLGGLIQFIWVSDADYIWETILRFQVLNWLPVLIAAAWAYIGVQKQINKAQTLHDTQMKSIEDRIQTQIDDEKLALTKALVHEFRQNFVNFKKAHNEAIPILDAMRNLGLDDPNMVVDEIYKSNAGKIGKFPSDVTKDVIGGYAKMKINIQTMSVVGKLWMKAEEKEKLEREFQFSTASRNAAAGCAKAIQTLLKEYDETENDVDSFLVKYPN